MNWTGNIDQIDKEVIEQFSSIGKLPKHVAIIMDGNGRWAIERHQNRAFGHRHGIEAVREIVKAASRIGIKYLTLYTFSIENWKRPAVEVNILLTLLEKYLKSEIDELDQNDVRLCSIGKISSMPKTVQKLLHDAYEKTKNNKGLTLNLALSYSGRWDIVRAVQMIALEVRRGECSPEDIDEALISSSLSTHDVPDPDLLIRTSGEMRLSNFLLWELAYSEIYITQKNWPDFTKIDFYEAVLEYLKRERRFGKTSEQINSNPTNINISYLQRTIDAIKK